MLKAYLAYSSTDKAFVDRVAKRLGRFRVIYDEMCFEPAVDFRQSIRVGLSKSCLFVFFASKRSLDSTWVKFEIDEAEWQILQGKMSGALGLIIDDDVKPEQLPHWMRRCLVASAVHPAQAVRVIQQSLIRESGLDKQKPFVGREASLAEFARQLITSPEEKPRRVIVVSGLDGIGRRTFVRRALADYLSLDIGTTYVLEDTDSLDKLYRDLLDETMELESRTKIAEALATFAASPPPAQAREIARLLAISAKANVAPVLVDRYALLDEHGKYLPEVARILEALKEREYEDTYLVLIHRRRPDFFDLVGKSPGVAFHKLDPLSAEATKLLLQQSFRIANIETTKEQVEELTIYMDGYPPAVELATTYAKLYGVETLLADPSILTDFKVRTFAPVLKRLRLNQQEWEILRILASEAALPLEVLTVVLGLTPEEIADALRHLIDLNLVLPLANQFEISAPIREAVHRARGPLTKEEYKTIAARLEAIYWIDPDSVPPLPVIDATIHALARSDAEGLTRFRDLILPSHLYKAAKEAYNSKNWSAAIEFAKRTLELDPDRNGARVTLFKAFVRQEQWIEAERVLRELESRRVRAQFYCKGFLEWKRGHLQAAVSAFRSALGAGDRSISVYRDLAHCLFRLGDIKGAKRVLGDAGEGAFRSSYVVDLAAQIAISSKDWEEAERYIAVLDHIDTKENLHHRRASLQCARQQWGLAFRDAEIACSGEAPRFEALAQRIDILIELGRFDEAEHSIDALRPFGIVQRNVSTGLRCKLLLRQGKWREAEVRWEELRQEMRPVHLGLRKEILNQKIQDPMTSLIDRREAVAEMEQLGEVLELPLATDEEEAE